jgi:cell wall-associated NlpC family hydrolase
MHYSTATPRRIRTGIVIRVLALAIFGAMFALLPNTARADSTATYDISGTLASGGTFNGTIEFDQSGSTLELVNSSFTLDGNSYSCGGASSNTCTVFDPVPFSWATIQGSSSLVVFQWLNSTFNISNPPSSFNFVGGYCLGCGFGLDFLTSGKATVVSTPEPASWSLLAAGILGLTLLSRRRPSASSNLG